jgi:hypothetical protein
MKYRENVGVNETRQEREHCEENEQLRPRRMAVENRSQHEQRNRYEGELCKAYQNPELVGEGMHDVF